MDARTALKHKECQIWQRPEGEQGGGPLSRGDPGPLMIIKKERAYDR